MLLLYVMFLFEKNDMLSTLVILKLMYDCARHSELVFLNVYGAPESIPRN
jgi:hypothetical protein